MLEAIEACVAAGTPIDRKHAASLFDHAEDATLSRLATRVRDRFHPAAEATY